MTRPEALAFVAHLAAFWPAHKVTAEVQDAWAVALEGFPLEIAKKAGAKLVGKSTFFPSFAELVQTMCDLVSGLPSPDEAWATVSTSHGTGNYPPLVKEALRAIGGSWELGHSGDLDSVRRNFLTVYKGLKEVRDGFIREQDLPALAAGKAVAPRLGNGTVQRCAACGMRPEDGHLGNCQHARRYGKQPVALEGEMKRVSQAIQNGALERRCKCDHNVLNHEHGKGRCEVDGCECVRYSEGA